MHEGGETRVSYDLTFIRGHATYFANLSEILFRPKSELASSIEYLQSSFPSSEIFQVQLSGSLRGMIQNAQRVLRFPADKSHSLDAFGDLLCDLSWVDSGHLIVIVEMTDTAEKIDQCMMIDTFSWATVHLNLERRIRLSVLVILN